LEHPCLTSLRLYLAPNPLLYSYILVSFLSLIPENPLPLLFYLITFPALRVESVIRERNEGRNVKIHEIPQLFPYSCPVNQDIDRQERTIHVIEIFEENEMNSSIY
jgi:hypothetical protein